MLCFRPVPKNNVASTNRCSRVPFRAVVVVGVVAVCVRAPIHSKLYKMGELCGRALLECAAGSSDDGTYRPQKLELCIAAADGKCSAIFEQRIASHGKDRRRGQSHPALRRAGGLPPSTLFRAKPTGGELDPPLWRDQRASAVPPNPSSRDRGRSQ